MQMIPVDIFIILFCIWHFQDLASVFFVKFPSPVLFSLLLPFLLIFLSFFLPPSLPPPLSFLLSKRLRPYETLFNQRL